MSRVKLVLCFITLALSFEELTLEFHEVSLILLNLLTLHAIFRKLSILSLNLGILIAFVNQFMATNLKVFVKTVELGLERSERLILLSLHQTNLLVEHLDLSIKESLLSRCTNESALKLEVVALQLSVLEGSVEKSTFVVGVLSLALFTLLVL